MKQTRQAGRVRRAGKLLLLLKSIGLGAFSLFILSCGDDASSSSDRGDKDPEAANQKSSRRTSPDGGPQGQGNRARTVPVPVPSNDDPDSEQERKWIAAFQNETTALRRREVLSQKIAEGPEFLTRLVRIALNDPSPAVREEATIAFSVMTREEGVPLMIEATGNDDEVVRSLALDEIFRLPKDERIAAYSETIQSSHDDVKRTSADRLANLSSPAAFEVLLTGLKDDDDGFREHVNNEIEIRTMQRFADYASAQAWWNRYKSYYSSTLQLMEALPPEAHPNRNIPDDANDADPPPAPIDDSGGENNDRGGSNP